MNKKIIKYAILSLTLTAGAAVAAVGFSMGAKNDYTQMLNLTNIESLIPTDGVASMNIDVNYADLEIEASNDVKNFEIAAENISRSYLKYSVSNNILNLKYSFNKWYEVSSVPILMKHTGKIKITVPADAQLQDIQIKSGTNNLSLSYITAENIYIDNGSGNKSVNSLNADSIEITGGSGSINASSLNCGKLSFSGGRGNCDIVDLNTGDIMLSSDSGDISAAGRVDGDGFVKSGTGDVNLSIFGNEKDFRVKVLKGSVLLNGRKSAGTENGKHNIEVTSGMGDVNILFK